MKSANEQEWKSLLIQFRRSGNTGVSHESGREGMGELEQEKSRWKPWLFCCKADASGGAEFIFYKWCLSAMWDTPDQETDFARNF